MSDADDTTDDEGEPAGAPYDTSAAKEAMTGAIEPATRVEDISDTSVARSATFADVARRPKETAIEQAPGVNDVVFYRNLVRLDGDLAGTIRAKAQVAAMGPEVTHPAMRGHEEELSDIERDVMESCAELLDRLDITREIQSFFKRLIIHGNDVSHIEYEDGVGVTDITPLPLQALTIRGEDPADNEALFPVEPDGMFGQADMNKTIHEANFYCLNEDDEDARETYPASDVIHMAINRRGNWYEDRLGRSTFNVWGERRLEPLKFALQAKQNTLSNKVALDDSLLAREVYHIDVETLFGHIPNDDERTEKAREYKEKLKAQLNSLAPDEKPILPKEVEVTVEGPDGKTADNQTGFIDMCNNTLQTALTFHSASFGRDAGGSLAGNRPSKEMSDTGVQVLRDIVKREFRELFRIHTLLTHPDARQPATAPDGTRDTEADGLDQWEIKDDVTLPTLVFDAVSRRDKSDRVKDAVAAYEKGVADLNEVRAWVDLDPIKDDDVDEMFFRHDPRKTAAEVEAEGEGGVGREQNESEPNQNQGPGQGKNPNDDGSGEASSIGDAYVAEREHSE